MTDPLARIAAALERIAPPAPSPADPLTQRAYVWRDGALTAARAFAPLPLDALVGLDAQKAALLTELARLAAGHAAQDVLLWGAQGSGKSALVKAAVAATSERLALVEVAGAALDSLPALFTAIAPLDRAFALFLDDLGFDTPADARALRSLLEGGAEARPTNARLVVTANRRHLLPRQADDDAANPRDVADDQLALADRFGLSLGFHAIDQAGFLAIVRSYASRHGLPLDPEEALRWAARRGSRSGRTAWQYIVDIAGREGRAL